MKLRETLAANLRREMAARNITSVDLAARCGWKQPRISEILRAEHSPTLDTVEQVATALGVAPPSLLLPLPEESSAPLLTR